MVAFLLSLFSFMAPGAQDAMRATSERYTVEALDPGSEGRPARVIISNHETSRRHMLSVNSTLGPLRRIVLRADQERMVFVCAKGFAVADPAGVENTDEVYGLDAVASPDGRWIAYRRFFPPTHPGSTEGILVYDTAKPARANHQAYPIPAEREWRAGWAVYPPAGEWTDANTVVSRDAAHVLTSPLAWEPETSNPMLVFAVRKGSADTVVLASASHDTIRTCWTPLPGGADDWRVKTIDARQLPTGERVVEVRSGAVATGAPRVTLRFPAGCEGAVAP